MHYCKLDERVAKDNKCFGCRKSLVHLTACKLFACQPVPMPEVVLLRGLLLM